MGRVANASRRISITNTGARDPARVCVCVQRRQCARGLSLNSNPLQMLSPALHLCVYRTGRALYIGTYIYVYIPKR